MKQQTKRRAVLTQPSETPEDFRFFSRELSWLEFNRRVLEAAQDRRWLLLDRLKFLTIFSSNLDEFFMIRVAGLKEKIEDGIIETLHEGAGPVEQLKEVGKRLRPMLRKQSACLQEVLLPEMRAAGISVESYKSLKAPDRRKLDRYFQDHIFPILTPQSVDSSHPFPYVSNLSLNLGLFIEPDKHKIKSGLHHIFKGKRFARIKLPDSVSRLIPLDKAKRRYALLEEVVAANVKLLFPGMKTSNACVFRVTRDADIELREDEADNLMRSLERELQRRRFRFPVRLEVSAEMPAKMIKVLTEGIGLQAEDVYQINGLLDIPDLMQLYDLDLRSLKEKPIKTVFPRAIDDKKNIFEVLKKKDLLLHHPYTSFAVVSDFLSTAAEDPKVQAIKICLYRTGKNSPIVESLIKAVRLGKQVTALVELKARFDEEKNIEWARRLENEGVHVVYGITGLKTHSKVLLVIRKEKNRLMRYAHIGTGNYNPITAKQYTDLALLTADDGIGADATGLFNFLTGYSQQNRYNRLIVAPLDLRERIVAMIRRERENKLAGKDAAIVMKLNSLADLEIVDELYAASTSGVEIDLIVRGTCVLRPGLEGLSPTIRVRSVVGRFLEHSRVFYFRNADGEEEMFIGSADMMFRNLSRRVEVLAPITDPSIRAYLKDVLLDAYLRDTVNTKLLGSDGSYFRVPKNEDVFDAQMFFVGRSPES